MAVCSNTMSATTLLGAITILPLLVLAIVALGIITYVPKISLWLPKKLYPGLE
jgi:C4-dicarboxylate transporter DctM subunit